MRPLFLIGMAAMPSMALSADFGVQASDYEGAAWSPYLVGAGIGVLSWLTFYFADKPIGVSSFYATLAGFAGKWVARRHTQSLKYFQKHPPSVNYGFAFVICIVLGAWIAAGTGGEIRNEWLHPMWVDRFGDSIALRGGIGFAGGALMAFGARLAGGCTSGHGISGTLQLNAGSWLTVLFMFLGGIPAAMLLYSLL